MSTKGTRRFRKQLTQERPDMRAGHGKGLCSVCGCILYGKAQKRRGTCGRCHSRNQSG